MHLCVDPAGRFVVNAHNFEGGGLTLHALDPDGAIGVELPQPAGLDFGIYPHQVRVFPSGRTVLVVDRGNQPQGDRAEQPGALRSFEFDDGVLRPKQVVAPNGGHGFGPRHVSFHPVERWMYASDERTNRLYHFRFDGEDQLEDSPAQVLPTLAAPSAAVPRQLAGAIHVDPRGRVVYVANRADQTVLQADGRPVFAGGENNIAVFSIDPVDGRPALLQHAQTGSFHVRTFACEPDGPDAGQCEHQAADRAPERHARRRSRDAGAVPCG